MLVIVPPARMTHGGMATNLGRFGFMALIWGGTPIAIKAGVSALPPVSLAAARYTLAGALLAILVRGFTGPFARPYVGRTLLTGGLVNVATYSLLFWGMQFVAAGVSGLINLSLTPVGLFGLTVILGEEKVRWRHALALVLGTLGLVLLFSGKITLGGDGAEIRGAFAIVAATLCYCWGTILSRPLLDAFAPLQVTAAQAIVGAAGLIALSLASEPLSLETLRTLGAPVPLAVLLYLSVASTIGAYAIYLRLVRDWTAPRAGLYAFVSPVVALVLGWLLFNEPLGWLQFAGTTTMLIAAATALAPHERPDKTHERG